MRAPAGTASSLPIVAVSVAAAWALVAGFVPVDRVDLLIALGPGVVVPLGLLHGDDPDARGESRKTHVVACWCVTIGGPLGSAAFLLGRGTVPTVLAAAWLLATIAVAVDGARRLARRGVRPLEELAHDLGCLYLPVGAIWSIASRAGTPLLGFHEPIVTFTAAHFHFAGFAAPVVVGALGRALRLRRAPGDVHAIASSGTRRRYVLGATVVIVAIPLVAAGIQLSRALELLSAIVLGLGMLVVASLLVQHGASCVRHGVADDASPLRVRIAGLSLLVAGASLVLSMALAVTFAVTSSAGIGARAPFIPLATMAALHGAANAIGFSVAASVAFALLRPRRRYGPLDGTWPRILARGFVGPDLFDRIGAIDATRTVHGQLDELAVFAHDGFHPEAVAPAIIDFYERTGEWEMDVIPHWPRVLLPGARLFARVARRFFGQLELPVERADLPAGERVDTRVFALRTEVDGRVDARGYVRTIGSRALLVAAYATHRAHARTLLVATFPLPRCTLVGALRMDDAPGGGLVVSSHPRLGEGPGDEGLFLLTPLGPLRLPIDETIHVEPEGNAARATHETRLLGIRLFTFEYLLRRRDRP